MRIACCLYGHVGGKSGRDGVGGWLDPLSSLQNYSQHLFYGKNVEYFVHCWSPDYQSKIEEYLKPVSSIFEPQKDFSTTHLDSYRLSMINDYRGIVASQENPALYLTELAKRARSRWMSTSKVFKLCRDYSESKNFSYDVIILLRFDLHFYKKLNIGVVEKDTLYTSRRLNDIENTVEDLVLFGRPEVVVKLIDIHENYPDYSIRPPSAIYQVAKKNKFIINDDMKRGRDFDLARESSNSSALTKTQKLRKKIKLLLQ